MARRPVELRLPAPITRGIASPVDTYIEPPRETEASQLATALAEVNPQLTRFSEVLSAKYMETQRARGERAARAEGEKALAAGELTRKGVLPKQDNPWFMAAYHEEWGRVAAGVMTSDFNHKVLPSIKDSTDIADFDKAIGKHVQEWVKEKGFDRNTHFEKGFGHAQDAYIAKARMAFGAQVEKNLETKSMELVFSSTRRNIADNTGVGLEVTAGEIEQRIQDFVALGLDETKVRTQVVAAIEAAAREAGGDKGKAYLSLLELVPGEGGEGSLKDQSYGSETYTKTRTKLLEDEHTALQRERQEAAYQEQEKRKEIWRKAGEDFAKNPGRNAASWARENFPDDLAMATEVANGIKRSATEARYGTNEYVKRDLYRRIFHVQEGEEKTTLEEVFKKAAFLSQDDQEELRRLIQSEEEFSARRGSGELTEAEQRLKRMDQISTARIKDGFPVITAGALYPDGDRVAYSLAYYENERQKLLASGKVLEMSEQDIIDWSTRVADEALQEYRTEKHRRAQQQTPEHPNYSGRPPAAPGAQQQGGASAAPKASSGRMKITPGKNSMFIETPNGEVTMPYSAIEQGALPSIAETVLGSSAPPAAVEAWVESVLEAYEQHLTEQMSGQ